MGWLTGDGPGSQPTAYETRDGGARWTAVQGSTGAAASAPCGDGKNWLLPVVDAGHHVTLLRTADAGMSWQHGVRVGKQPATPVWGCLGSDVWMAVTSGGSEHLMATHDAGRTWSDEGRAPDALTSVVLVGQGKGFAVSGTGSTVTLWSVSADGAAFQRRTLPAWVTTLGDSQSTS